MQWVEVVADCGEDGVERIVAAISGVGDDALNGVADQLARP